MRWIRETVSGRMLFNIKAAIEGAKAEYIFIAVLLVYVMLSGIIMLVIVRIYQESKYQKQILDLNMNVLKQEYRLLLEAFAEKRRLVHDGINHDLVLLGMLKENKVDSATAYLEKKLEKTKVQSICRYTGVLVIDIILNYKIQYAMEQGITVNVDSAVHFCPMNEPDMCIVIGNLLDNAIDALMLAPEKEQVINMTIKTPNRMFLLDISNPYEGQRKKWDGHYVTTKSNRQIHGIGLSSVENTVMNNGGQMVIDDKNEVFKVSVTIFCDAGVKRQSSM